MPTLPKLESLKPEENTLEQGLILILKLAYGISNADAERIHQLSMSMFYQGCVTGAETVMTALNNELILRKAASAPSSESIN
jgi:hypothetical protein